MTAAPDPSELADVAERLAREAGRLLREGIDVVRAGVETKTSRTDMVTDMDRASEALIDRRLSECRPHDGLVGEEGANRQGSSGVSWIVDPLDGTTNYLYGFPAFAVSIAAQHGGAVVAGAVHDPTHDETFTAHRGGGARCNGRVLRISGPPTLATALVGTGFSYDAGRRGAQAALLPRVLPAVRDIRRAGAAALDLCWVGAARLDAFYEFGLQHWDWAAGGLVAEEAGARLEVMADGTLVAAPPHLFDALAALVDGRG